MSRASSRASWKSRPRSDAGAADHRLVVQSLEPAAAAKRIAVDDHLDPTIGPIAVDPDRLQQIVWHLVSNAIKFTP